MSGINKTAVGVGVTLGVLVFIVLAVFVGMMISGARSAHDRRRLLHSRRDQLRAQRLEEIRDWRTRRLRDVVLLLVERGEAFEGIPLAVQLPGKSEVSCRRRIRRAQPYNMRDELEDELRAEAEANLPEEVRRVMYQSLPELLASGRPPEAQRGPDIMQMLLDGQEPRALSSSHATSDEDWTSTASASATPPPPPATTNTNANNPPPTGSSGGGSNNGGGGASDPHAQWAAERQAAIIRELHAERDHQRRRRTAEEVYGEGYAYVTNPDNVAFSTTVVDGVADAAPQSPLRRLLSPLSPFPRRQRSYVVQIEPGTPVGRRMRTVATVACFDEMREYGLPSRHVTSSAIHLPLDDKHSL